MKAKVAFLLWLLKAWQKKEGRENVPRLMKRRKANIWIS